MVFLIHTELRCTVDHTSDLNQTVFDQQRETFSLIVTVFNACKLPASLVAALFLQSTAYVRNCYLLQNAGRSHSIETANIPFERMEEFKYLGTTLTNQILFKKKLRTDLNQRKLAIFRCRIFYLPVCYTKI